MKKNSMMIVLLIATPILLVLCEHKKWDEEESYYKNVTAVESLYDDEMLRAINSLNGRGFIEKEDGSFLFVMAVSTSSRIVTGFEVREDQNNRSSDQEKWHRIKLSRETRKVFGIDDPEYKVLYEKFFGKEKSERSRARIFSLFDFIYI